MIEITTNVEKLKEELILILKLFYSEKEIEYRDDFIALILSGHRLTLNFNDEQYYKKIDNESQILTKEIKKKAKALLYKVLSKKTGKSFKYGALTGIRPTKLFYDLLNEHKVLCKVRRILKNEYFVSKDAINLLESIVKNQNYVKNDSIVDLYINIPFCTSKCYYCSFISMPLAKCKQYVKPYIDALKQDILDALGIIEKNRYSIGSIYMGGGTPTALSADELEEILKLLPKVNEFTVECGRPDTITKDKLEVLEKYGVTRISVNPQTFNDKTLKEIGRNHTSAETEEIYNLARKFSFDINMDLIAGLGNESFNDFKFSLDKALSFKPDNITVHTLCKKRASSLNLDGGETSGQDEVEKMVEYSIKQIIGNGYLPYYLYKQKNAIANLENIGYAKPGKFCEFNIDSMEEIRTIIACGANAISKKYTIKSNRIERFAFVKEPKEYIERLDEALIKRRELFK